MPETTALDMSRAPKVPGEKTETISVRVGPSLKAYLMETDPRAGVVAYDVLLFERDLTEMLAQDLVDLRISAAHHGDSYELDRAETIARLVKLGLAAEKKAKR